MMKVNVQLKRFSWIIIDNMMYELRLCVSLILMVLVCILTMDVW